MILEENTSSINEYSYRKTRDSFGHKHFLLSVLAAYGTEMAILPENFLHDAELINNLKNIESTYPCYNDDE